MASTVWLQKLYEAKKNLKILKEKLSEDEIDFINRKYQVLVQAHYRRELTDKEKQYVNSLLKKAGIKVSSRSSAMASFADNRDTKSPKKSAAKRAMRSEKEQKKLESKSQKRKEKKKKSLKDNDIINNMTFEEISSLFDKMTGKVKYGAIAKETGISMRSLKYINKNREKIISNKQANK